jgi:glycosylphosphatidylinositol transamidase (GPIT) subunit GPI8
MLLLLQAPGSLHCFLECCCCCRLPAHCIASWNAVVVAGSRLAALLYVMLLLVQAASMFQKFYSPNILAVASSLVGEDSLSHHVDPAIGQPL